VAMYRRLIVDISLLERRLQDIATKLAMTSDREHKIHLIGKIDFTLHMLRAALGLVSSEDAVESKSKT
jgi:hypothetical protein